MKTRNEPRVDLRYLHPQTGEVDLLVRILYGEGDQVDLMNFKAGMAEYGVRLGVLCDPVQISVVRDPLTAEGFDPEAFHVVSHPTKALFRHDDLGPPKHNHEFEEQAKEWLHHVATAWLDALPPRGGEGLCSGRGRPNGQRIHFRNTPMRGFHAQRVDADRLRGNELPGWIENSARFDSTGTQTSARAV